MNALIGIVISAMFTVLSFEAAGVSVIDTLTNSLTGL